MSEAPSALFIRHYTVFARVAQLTPLRGHVTEISRESLPADTTLDRGFFADSRGGLVAVYASPKGPMLVVDERHLRLIEGECTATVTGGRFTLERRGHAPLTIEYTPPKGAAAAVVGPWEDEDDLDFFGWLGGRLAQSLFFSHYRV